ncbi:MAG: phosphotransferase [Akkermansia sp.]
MTHALQELASLASRHYGIPVSEERMTPIVQGASGRTIVRIAITDNESIMGISWTNNRPDNDAFVGVARQLAKAGVNVPDIIDYLPSGQGCGMALTKDLGDINLLSLAGVPDERKKEYYTKALQQLHLLHQAPISIPLQPPFDESLYRWEQEYFAEYFIQGVLKCDTTHFLNHPACRQLACELATLPRKPLHRDFQSQNIHLVHEEAWLIDFQGMRYGLPEYDLASLLYDPYAKLNQQEREQLIVEWENIEGSPLNRELFIKCALQRLMQATGAYAKLGIIGTNKWYRSHLPTAIQSLIELTPTSSLESALLPILESAPASLPPCS